MPWRIAYTENYDDMTSAKKREMTCQLFNFKSNIIKQLSINDNVIIYPPFPTVSEGDWVFRNYWSDWIFDPPLNDDPNQHNIENKDRPKNPILLKQLPFNVIHLGEAGKNGESRITKHFK
jgi:hypothetical protein